MTNIAVTVRVDDQEQAIGTHFGDGIGADEADIWALSGWTESILKAMLGLDDDE